MTVPEVGMTIEMMVFMEFPTGVPVTSMAFNDV